MQACVDLVLIIFGTQVIKKKRPVRPVFRHFLSVSYDYDLSDLSARSENSDKGSGCSNVVCQSRSHLDN